MKESYIFDLDGVLCNSLSSVRIRRLLEAGDYQEWSKSIDCFPAFEEAIQLVRNLYNAGYFIIFMTARGEEFREATESWIKLHIGIQDYSLLMRPVGDSREDQEVKLDLTLPLLSEHVILAAFDDNPENIKMFEDIGIYGVLI